MHHGSALTTYPCWPAPLPPGRYQFYRGTVTKAICTSCQDGYTVKSSGRACCEGAHGH